MRSPPPPVNPMEVAQESLRMSKDSGERAFKLMAMGMMIVTGVATSFHALHLLFRDAFGGHGERSRRRDEGRLNHPDQRDYRRPVEDTRSQDEEVESERHWSRREEIRGRSTEGKEGWTAHRHRNAHSRER